MNKLITWNPIREMDEAQNRFNPFFLGGFPNRMGSDEIHSLTVADWSPEVDISEDDRGYLLKADLPEIKKDDVWVTSNTAALAFRKRKTVGDRKDIPSHRAVFAIRRSLSCLKMPIARSAAEFATEC